MVGRTHSIIECYQFLFLFVLGFGWRNVCELLKKKYANS